jgi:mannose-6-phosphate isomerase-like protein (cupin superfamily)
MPRLLEICLYCSAVPLWVRFGDNALIRFKFPYTRSGDAGTSFWRCCLGESLAPINKSGEKTMSNISQPLTAEASGNYRVGDRDDRPWGHYVVTAVGHDTSGEEFCEKKITIDPLQILSLQSHRQRRETWTVRRGHLTALKEGQRVELSSGESIHIPAGAIHCMANLGDEDCIVEERQEGICREEDVQRFMDVYRRDTETLEASPTAVESFAIYRDVIIDINRIRANKKHGVPY